LAAETFVCAYNAAKIAVTMKIILPAAVTAPTILIFVVALFGIFTRRFLFEEFGLSSLVGIYPVLAFTICVALSLVFPREREWKIAAAINGFPLLLLLVLAVFLRT
jgi:hypothetical protein